MKAKGFLGKVITLGAILNIVVFFILLKFDKEQDFIKILKKKLNTK